MIAKTIKYILSLVLTCFSLWVVAQRDTTLTQEVEVVKAYKPTISDANKINDMPKINEAKHQKPTFNYSIFSQPVFSTFSVNSLKAATVSGRPKENDGFGLIRAGFGNYTKPYAELFFNSQNTRNTIFGLHGKHLSSLGKIKLEGKNKVDAPFSDNQAEMYVKHLFRNSILSVNVNFDHNGFRYYGYPVDSIPQPLTDENQNISYQGKKQTFTKGGINIGLVNSTAGSKKEAYDFNFNYHYFGTKTEQREHFGELTTKIRKPLGEGIGILNAGARFVKTENIYNRTLNTIGNNQQIWLSANPSYFIGNDVANINLGFNGWFVMNNDDDTRAKLAPNIKANFSPVKEIITLFAGIDGNYINNHYSKIAYENPFVDPNHQVKNTFEQFHFYGGFDGKFAAKTNFKIAVDYSILKDKPLYYLFGYVYPTMGPLPAPTVVDNDFDILYDDINQLKFNVEIFHTSTDKFDLLFSGNYYVYKLNSQSEAWNLPDWDSKFSINYKATEQLSFSTNIYLIGQRKALVIESTTFDPRTSPVFDPNSIPTLRMNSYNLNTVIDLNAGANYKITQKLAAFASLNNFGFQRYQKWFGYPVQSFNFLAGFSYAF